MNYRIGVDVGGTFTDLVLIDELTDQISVAKVPSTPSSPDKYAININIAKKTSIIQTS